jgi:hypothetical protein
MITVPKGAAPTALVIVIMDPQPSRAGLTFGYGPPGLDEGERSATLLRCNTELLREWFRWE